MLKCATISTVHENRFQCPMLIFYPSSFPTHLFFSYSSSSSLPKARPFLRTEGNSPSYHHSDASPRLLPVSIVWVLSQMEAVAAAYASCFLVLTVHVLCVSGQFTGTEMPCEDLSPSPSTPTSGKMVYTHMLGISGVRGGVFGDLLH